MADTSRVERLKSGIVVVRRCTVNYDLTPAEAIEGLSYNDDLIGSSYDPAYWNGGKSGIIEGATIPLLFPRHVFTITEGRQGLVAQNVGYGVPADLVPLKDKEVRRALIDVGIWWVAAFDKSGEALWQDPVHARRVVSLSLHPRYLGFCLCAGNYWRDLAAVVGSPQVS